MKYYDTGMIHIPKGDLARQQIVSNPSVAIAFSVKQLNGQRNPKKTTHE